MPPGWPMGLAIAHQLARRGQQVTVLSRWRSAAGFVAAGMLAPHAEQRRQPAAAGQCSLERVRWVGRLRPTAACPVDCGPRARAFRSALNGTATHGGLER